MALKKFNFNVIDEDKYSRKGSISTHRGKIQTPVLMPDGTQATVKSIFIDDVILTGSQIILSNTYHLMIRPGVERIKRDGFGRKNLFNCFVAEFNSEVVGMALFYPRYSTWKGPTLHLEDLIVTESMKGRGIGTKLYDTFISFAISKGVKRVEWVVLDWNKSRDKSCSYA